MLSQNGDITNIELLSPGEFYFPTDFGKGIDDRAPPESLGLTIFDWDYINDPDSPTTSTWNSVNYWTPMVMDSRNGPSRKSLSMEITSTM